MKNTDHFNIPYPETTDLVSQFPDQVAKSTAELIDTFLYEQEQKQTAIDAALAGKAPLSHTHPQSQVTGLDAALAGKAPLSHTHPQSQVTGLDAALAGKAPLSHTHSTSQVTGLDSALQGKAPLSHTHPQSQVTGLDAALAGKAPLSHTHSTSQVTGLDAALAGKAPLPTLNTRVPENLALRIDTSVGTRVFAGNTMIYGDTGWRDITSIDANASISSGKILLRYLNGVITLRFDSVVTVTKGISLPLGSNWAMATNGYPIERLGSTPDRTVRLSWNGDHQVLTTLDGTVTFIGNINYVARNAYPTSLPGTPA